VKDLIGNSTRTDRSADRRDAGKPEKREKEKTMSDLSQREPTPAQTESINQGLEDLANGRRFTSDEMKQRVKSAPEIGAIESTGEHKGEIYGGIFPDGKPGWISEEPNPMSHYAAEKLKDRALPTSEEGKYIDTIKGKGALKDIFARHSDSSSSAGFFWLAEPSSSSARCQQFSDGSQYYDTDLWDFRLPVLSVRR
jgi:predicted transcriptional regulator